MVEWDDYPNKYQSVSFYKTLLFFKDDEGNIYLHDFQISIRWNRNSLAQHELKQYTYDALNLAFHEFYEGSLSTVNFHR